jgi:hypothetical protein
VAGSRRATTRVRRAAHVAHSSSNTLKKPLAEALLFGELKNGGKALAQVKADGSGLELSFSTAEA